MVIDNLRLVGIIEYLVGVYSFHFAVELFLVPMLFVFSGAAALAEDKQEHQPAYKLLNSVLITIAVSILGATLYFMATDFSRVASREGVYDFFVPPILTAAYIPFITFMMAYSTYQNIFIRLRFSIRHRSLVLYARLAVLVVFNFRITLLDRWATNVAKLNIESVADINQSISQVFDMVKREKTRQKLTDLKVGLLMKPRIT